MPGADLLKWILMPEREGGRLGNSGLCTVTEKHKGMAGKAALTVRDTTEVHQPACELALSVRAEPTVQQVPHSCSRAVQADHPMDSYS